MKVQLKPGATNSIVFSKGLPDTYHAMVSKKNGAKPMLTFRLPDDYSLKRQYPLMVYIDGGSGGAGDNLEFARTTTKGRKFITVNLPLFKKHVDKEEIFEGFLIMGDDYDVVAPAYEKMLTKLFNVIPNINFKGNSMGGFSNGAHATSLLIGRLNDFLLDNFRNFYLVDGGFWMQNLPHKRVRGKRFILFVGGRSDQELEAVIPYRRVYQDYSRISYEWGKMNNVDIRRVVMRGSGHTFPPRYHKVLRAWLYEVNGFSLSTCACGGK